MPRSLVLGVNGQDGSYLAETLLARNHDVIGVGRRAASRYLGPSPRFRYVQLDVGDSEALAALINSLELDHAFHFAVVHGASGFAFEPVWREMMNVNVLALHVLLEHARTKAPNLRIVYAGSCKIFPPPLAGTLDETTPAKATCLYGIGKIAARDLILQYARKHGVKATNLILFHHESPRRQREFLFPTIVNAIASARVNPSHQTRVRTLDFWIDWGAADEFMEIVADVAERTTETELALASGRTWYARDAVEHLFRRYGLDASRHISETDYGAASQTPFDVRLDRLEQAIGWKPRKRIDDVADWILNSVEVAERQSA